jgi:hypothetical protein
MLFVHHFTQDQNFTVLSVQQLAKEKIKEKIAKMLLFNSGSKIWFKFLLFVLGLCLLCNRTKFEKAEY